MYDLSYFQIIDTATSYECVRVVQDGCVRMVQDECVRMVQDECVRMVQDECVRMNHHSNVPLRRFEAYLTRTVLIIYTRPTFGSVPCGTYFLG